MANFEQAIKWLEEGYGIKRTNWRIDGEVHLILKEEDGEKNVLDCYEDLYRFDYDDITAKNWIIYKEKITWKAKKILI